MTGIAIGYRLPDPVLVAAPDLLLATVRTVEAAGVEYLVLPDRPAGVTDRPGPPAVMVLAAWLAPQTHRIGLVVTASPAYNEPYNLARLLASLDHISAGRAGWLVVTGPDVLSDANHRRSGFDPADGRAARAAEYVPVMRDLWDSWEDGAFLHDTETGQFIDPDRIHAIDHSGPALRVRGPLNLVRPPQGHPVVFASAADPLVAPAADVLTVGEPEAGTAAGTAAGPARPAVLVVLAFVGRSGEQAAQAHALAGAPSGDREHAVLVGDPERIAGELTRRLGRSTGVTVEFSTPDQMHLFTEQVLPRIRPARPGGGTLRERLDLPRPTSRFATPAAAGAERS